MDGWMELGWSFEFELRLDMRGAWSLDGEEWIM